MSSLFLLQSPPLLFPSLPFSSKTTKTLTTLKSFPFYRRSIISLHVINSNDRTLNPNFTGGDHTTSDQQLPAVRSYETDLACLTLVGSVDFEQAITAAAADGGEAADEHLANNMETMVVETIFPGNYDERSTVSTRLFLPRKKVKEKAMKLRSSLTADILSKGSVPKNILAMTFRQVVLQSLWSYKLSAFRSGTKRDMEHLANPREVQAEFTVSSPDRMFLLKLSEVVCLCALESTKKLYIKNIKESSSNSIINWFKQPLSSSSNDSSICVHILSQRDMAKTARNHLEKFYLVNGKSAHNEQKKKHILLEAPNFSELDKIGGPGFSEWAKEFVPAYKLLVDGNVFKDTKFEGWQELSNNRWEVLLTHLQMDQLISILDMYYEDRYTLPSKELSCGLVIESSITSKKNLVWKVLFVSMTGVGILIIISILAQIFRPNLLKTKKVSDLSHLTYINPSHEPYTYHLKSLNASEVKPLCISIIQKIKDELGWSGDILFDTKCGAWTGALPSYLREQDIILSDKEQVSHSSSTDSPVQDIASYQVVMSENGNIIGFQPTSRVAVNHWATNPLAKVLYGGRKIAPGILEPSLKIPRPSEVVVLELLMSVNSEPRFALARPMQ